MPSELKRKIIPILYHCQMYKADLTQFKSCQNWDPIVKSRKMFFTYYSALFCRMLYYLETMPIEPHFIQKCNDLIGMYNWFDIQESDLRKFYESGGSNREYWYKSEVPELLEKEFPELDGTPHFKNDMCTLFDENGKCRSHWEPADIRGNSYIPTDNE